MSRARSRDTAPELAVRRRLFARGLRYRVDAPIPGLPRRRADLLFGPAHVAVFIDGCFWHGCPEHGVLPKANAQWWRDKLERNQIRDAETNDYLRTIGWLPLRFWEHEDSDLIAETIVQFLTSRRV